MPGYYLHFNMFSSLLDIAYLLMFLFLLFPLKKNLAQKLLPEIITASCFIILKAGNCY